MATSRPAALSEWVYASTSLAACLGLTTPQPNNQPTIQPIMQKCIPYHSEGEIKYNIFLFSNVEAASVTHCVYCMLSKITMVTAFSKLSYTLHFPITHDHPIRRFLNHTKSPKTVPRSTKSPWCPPFQSFPIPFIFPFYRRQIFRLQIDRHKVKFCQHRVSLIYLKI